MTTTTTEPRCPLNGERCPGPPDCDDGGAYCRTTELTLAGAAMLAAQLAEPLPLPDWPRALGTDVRGALGILRREG